MLNEPLLAFLKAILETDYMNNDSLKNDNWYMQRKTTITSLDKTK